MTGFTPGSIDNLIESDMDKFGLQHTLQRLELICAEKAAHIVQYQGGATLAKKWAKFADMIKDLSQKAAEELP